eukprot:1147131-Pelagomonas_calceolata.AAC.4
MGPMGGLAETRWTRMSRGACNLLCPATCFHSGSTPWEFAQTSSQTVTWHRKGPNSGTKMENSVGGSLSNALLLCLVARVGHKAEAP